jgi:hypothetical protein
VTNDGAFDINSITWQFGNSQLGTGPTLALNVASVDPLSPYNILGVQRVYVEGRINGAPFGREVIFTVAP